MNESIRISYIPEYWYIVAWIWRGFAYVSDTLAITPYSHEFQGLRELRGCAPWRWRDGAQGWRGDRGKRQAGSHRNPASVCLLICGLTYSVLRVMIAQATVSGLTWEFRP
jgi:hypothetical protein